MLNNNSVFDRVKFKNLNLSAQEYNTISTNINKKGILFTSDQQYKDAMHKKESIIARMDTNIHIKKEQGGYDANIGVEQLNQLGNDKEIRTNVLRKEYIEKGSPKKTKNSVHKIEKNPISLTINKYRLERAIKATKNYQHNRIMNSTPI